MRGQTFDDLAKGLANGTSSRRGFLTTLAAALAGATVPAVARAQDGPGGSACVNQGQSCTAQQCCHGLSCLTDDTSSTDKFCCPDVAGQLVCGSRCCPTGAVSCSGGQCVCPSGTPDVCPDNDNLNFAGKCTNLQDDLLNCGACGVVCPGSTDPCRIEACVSGQCTTIPNPAADTLPCETGNLCTADFCENGTCREGAVTVACPQCQVCDPATGTCRAVVNGTACEDGNLCTLNDSCQNGVCQPGPLKNCSDGDPCTSDTCNPLTGACASTPVPGCVRCTGNDTTPCPKPANPCRQAACIGGICDSVPKANGSPCSDGNVCTSNDGCVNGTCVGFPVICGPTTQCCPAGSSAPGACRGPAGAPCTNSSQCCNKCVNFHCT